MTEKTGMPDEDLPAGDTGILSRLVDLGFRPWSELPLPGWPGTGPGRLLGGRHDSYAATALGDVLDRSVHAQAAQLTGGLSMLALWLAYLDWWMHLCVSPGRQGQLRMKAVRKVLRYLSWLARSWRRNEACELCIDPLPQDSRFRSEGWQQWPYNTFQQGFLLTQQWWHNATSGVRGVDAGNEAIVTFATRQVLDFMSPSNLFWTNPDVARLTMKEGGANLLRGFQYFVEDWERFSGGHPPIGAERFAVGVNLATTPGDVVFRNRLIELIQYRPATRRVHPEPILITPAWIMKYYVLDLSPGNSLVEFLVGAGFTVFMISWKNPDPEDRDLGLDDYLELGQKAALDAVLAITGAERVHCAGYCLGGTLLTIAAAWMAGAGRNPIASLSFFAAQADFTEAGELTLFVNESQLCLLEDMMWEQGFLDTLQMSGAFRILRSNDLIFSRNMRTYLLGERDEMDELMAWNADGTRMPFRMHSEYLRRLFLNNDLAEGRLTLEGKAVFLDDIRVPVFALGTEYDHIAPWPSVFKIHQLTDSEVTFVLASGGHNRGVVAAPGRKDAFYHIQTRAHEAPHVDPASWLETASRQSGSWWPAWTGWLQQRSGKPVQAPEPGGGHKEFAPIAHAPGRYVLVR